MPEQPVPASRADGEAATSVPAMMVPAAAPRSWRDSPLLRSGPGLLGLGFLVLMLGACVLTLPWTLGAVSLRDGGQVPRYSAGLVSHGRLPPAWWPREWWARGTGQTERLNALVDDGTVETIASAYGMNAAEVRRAGVDGEHSEVAREVRRHMQRQWPGYALGTDVLGRSLAVRLLTGGGISLGIGIAAAGLSVLIGTLYGAVAGYVGGRVDAVMMRVVDVLYGLPYILLVVLLAVAVDAWVEKSVAGRVERVSERRERWVSQQMELEGLSPEVLADGGAEGARQDRLKELAGRAVERFGTGEMSAGALSAINVVTLLVAIGGVSWLTMSRVIRGQVLSLKAQPFVEAARAAGASGGRVFVRHLLPNLVGPIVVYATLTVPQAILQESFLSFLGIGVKPPLPSWGNLASEGLSELNTFQSNWWLLVFPCVLLGSTLLAMNFVGEGLREAFDPRRGRR